MDIAPLLERIEAKRCVVGIVGLGYVGLPLGLAFARSGYDVVGFDVDPSKIQDLRRGKTYLKHIPATDLGDLVSRGKLTPTSDFAQVRDCDALLLCVPTPLTKNREPDMTYVVDTANTIAPYLRAGQMVVLESTTYPGTTDELLRSILEEASNVAVGRDLFLAYSPEREDPGNPDFSTSRIPKLVGGADAASAELAVALYRQAIGRVIPVSSTRVAEMAKVYENVFRAVNIALVNELKILCHRMDLDVWEVIEAAATKPFGFMPFYPGPGLGGHCIPLDPFYLTWKAREFGLNTRFIELAGEVNTSMPLYVVERTAEALNRQAKALNGSRILVLGLAYKKDVDDTRESPAFRIIELLQARMAEVSYHDPHVPHMPLTRHHDLRMSSVELTESRLRDSDAVLIVTDHTAVDYERVVRYAPLVVDTRNATGSVSDARQKIVKA